MSLQYQITHRNEQIRLPEEDVEAILRLAGWEETPTFLTEGRTAWYKLKEPVAVEGGITVKAVKMKGVGVWNPEGRHADEFQKVPIPPTDRVYMREAAHFGFHTDGTLKEIYSEDAPYGGICHHRAIREYENAEILCRNGVPSILPYLVIEYPDLLFKGQTMGAVLSLCSEAEPYRLLFLGWDNRYVDANVLEYYKEIQEVLGISGDLREASTKLRMSQKIGEQFGRAVRGLSESGLFIHSGGWENIQFSRESGRIFLTDLDSTRSQSGLLERMRPVQALRDFVSNLYRYVNKLYYPKAISVYGTEELLEYDVVFHLMKGYLYEIEDDTLKQAAKEIWRFFMPYFDMMKKNEGKLEDIPKDIRKSFKFDTDLFYLVCLNLLYPLFLRTESNTIGKDFYSPEELLINTKAYLGSRFAYLEMHLSGLNDASLPISAV
ncbi:hypothetical protein [Paenibacillus wynnii]|uniref:hypothetical protein n=1 Tax=Paenibacillus wynnii TaxID=268407 RepID=UPI000AB83804|nr:hypothetical protein [Paenibacillus wynnii]